MCGCCQVADSVQRGARVLYQSPIPTGRIGAAGIWFPVTVLGGLTQEMPIQHCETFGPVVAIGTFDGSEASALALANESEYGLAAYVYTTDMEKAKRVGTAIRAGQVRRERLSPGLHSSQCLPAVINRCPRSRFFFRSFFLLCHGVVPHGVMPAVCALVATMLAPSLPGSLACRRLV